MSLIISTKVRQKLANKQPPVTEEEIIQCFANKTGKALIDTREDHLTNPYTRWFIAETDYGRKLKVAYVPMGGSIHIKSAYDPEPAAICIYNKLGYT